MIDLFSINTNEESMISVEKNPIVPPNKKINITIFFEREYNIQLNVNYFITMLKYLHRGGWYGHNFSSLYLGEYDYVMAVNFVADEKP